MLKFFTFLREIGGNFCKFIANFFREDKPEDIDKIIELGISVVNSIYFLGAGLNPEVPLNMTLVITLYFLALTGMLGDNAIKRSKKK